MFPPLQIVDVFSARALRGNPVAVVKDAGHWPTTRMQEFARWINLSETVFLKPATESNANYGVRIFTPRRELPFAGHPSLGAACAAFSWGILANEVNSWSMQCEAGVLPMQKTVDEQGRSLFHVRAPVAKMQAMTASAQLSLANALGSGVAIDGFAAHINVGPTWSVFELGNSDQLLALQPDFATLGHWTQQANVVGVAAFARSADQADQAYVHARCFCPADGIVEDPITGSGQVAIAAQLQLLGRLPGNGYLARQGHAVDCDGEVHIRLDRDGRFWVGGLAQCLVHGELGDALSN
jgi:PhzF family phenazine biosynthesis protein